VAQVLVQSGQLGEARRVASEALATAQAIADEGVRGWALRGVVQVLVQVGASDQAVTTAETIHDERMRAGVLSSVAQALVESGGLEEARRVASEALATAQTIADEGARAEVLSRVAQAWVESGRQEQADTVASVALRAAEMITGQQASAPILTRVAQTLALAGEPGAALQMWEPLLLGAQARDRQDVFGVLAGGAPIIAAADGGLTLWRLYEAVVDIESWWTMA
jgi:hypothetical protein